MTDIARWKFNKIIGIAATTPFASLAVNRMAQAAELVDPESAAAKGLQFVLESNKEGMQCDGCNFYTASDDGETGKCIIFGGGSVPAAGWCTAFQAKK